MKFFFSEGLSRSLISKNGKSPFPNFSKDRLLAHIRWWHGDKSCRFPDKTVRVISVLGPGLLLQMWFQQREKLTLKKRLSLKMIMDQVSKRSREDAMTAILSTKEFQSRTSHWMVVCFDYGKVPHLQHAVNKSLMVTV